MLSQTAIGLLAASLRLMRMPRRRGSISRIVSTFLRKKNSKDETRLMFFDLKPFKDAQAKAKQAN